jgi:hypothetical protein
VVWPLAAPAQQPTMRQTHIAGEKMFVDYSGTKLQVMDWTTGEVLTAELFVAVLGASSVTYAEATWTQTLPDWIGAHTRAFNYFGGVTAIVVSDNLKSGIIKACFYEPNVNRTYEEMAKHYKTAIVPARPKKPRDKAKVEAGVQVATRWVIAKLRKRTFFSLSAREVNLRFIPKTKIAVAPAIRRLDALTRLPPIQRDILVLREMEGSSYAEISQITGAAIGTVMSRLSRARAELVRSVGAKCATPSLPSAPKCSAIPVSSPGYSIQIGGSGTKCNKLSYAPARRKNRSLRC